jgi:preprotein translocase subunit SecY
VWTAFAILVYLAGGWILLPGFHGEELARVAAVGKASFDHAQFSIFALGVTPWLTSFAVVEIAAWIRRPWRGLRDTLDGRRKLERAVVILAIVSAAVQAYLFVTFIEGADPEGLVFDRQQFWPCVATLAAGPMALRGLVALISSRGVGNGYVVMFLVAWLRSISWGALPVGAELALAAVIAAATVVIALGMLGWRVRAPGRVAVPVPTSSIAPLHYGGRALALLGPLAALGAIFPAWLTTLTGNLKLGLLVIVASTVLLAFVFARPGRRGAELAAAKLAPTDRTLWVRAVLITMAALAALFALALITPGGVIGKLCDPGFIVIAAAMTADVVSDVRARRRANLVPVWPLHDPLLVDAARDVLGDLPHVIQWTRVRTLLWMFGAFVPMIVLAPEARAAEAHARLRAWLDPSIKAGG